MLREKCELVESFRVIWQGGDEAIRTALASELASELPGAQGQGAGAAEDAGARGDPASERIEQLEAALAKSEQDRERALGRALRAEMRT